MEKEEWLQIDLERSGGLLGIPRTFIVESKSLDAKERAALDRLIARADFFNLPERYSETGQPDAFEYRLTIKSATKKHTVVFHDQDGHPQALDELETWVRNH